MKKIAIALSIIMLIGCTTKSNINGSSTFPQLTGKYLGQKKPTLSPEIFAPNIISTGMSEINATFSPDYKEFLYTIILPSGQYVIMTMSYSENKWSEPQVASFSGKHSDADPFITHDRKWLYFVSKRPVDGEQKVKEDWDIWRLEKVNGEWSNLEKLGSDINSKTNDIYPTLTKDGTLYYSSGKGEKDNNDLFYAKAKGDNFAPSIKLNDEINRNWTGDVFISPEEDYMIYGSYGKREESGLYITFNNDGAWTSPVRMGEEINRTGNEFCPIVSPDGKYFFFTSNRKVDKRKSKEALSLQKIKEDFIDSFTSPGNGQNDVYWVDAKIIDKYREKGH